MKKFYFVNFATGIAVIISVIIGFVAPLIGFMSGLTTIKVLSWVIWLAFSIIMLYGIFGRKIVIGEDGVKFITLFKTTSMLWNQMAEVGVARLIVGVPVIYFTIEPGVTNIMKLRIDETMIMMRYRKSAIKEIRKYWPGEIIQRY